MNLYSGPHSLQNHSQSRCSCHTWDEVCSGSFQEIQSLFGLSGSPLKPGKFRTSSTSLKWTWKINPVLLNPHSASNKYATVRPSPERQRDSQTHLMARFHIFHILYLCIAAKEVDSCLDLHNPASPMAPEGRQEVICDILKTHFTANPSGASFQIRSPSKEHRSSAISRAQQPGSSLCTQPAVHCCLESA